MWHVAVSVKKVYQMRSKGANPIRSQKTKRFTHILADGEVNKCSTYVNDAKSRYRPESGPRPALFHKKAVLASTVTNKL